jgi:hypothetical protein
MKITGSVEIRRIDSVTGEVVEVIKQDNLIPAASLLGVLDWNGSYRYFGDRRISISTSTATPTILNSTLTDIIATGYIPANVTSPTWNPAIDPPYGQIQNRIDFTGTSRTFNSVGLTSSQPNNNQNNVSTTTFAYLKLDTPCTQGATEFLDIFYRIQFTNSGGGQGFIGNDARYGFGQRLFTAPSGSLYTTGEFGMSAGFVSPFNLNLTYDRLLADSGNYLYYSRPGTQLSGWNQALTGTVSSHYKWKYVASHNRDTYVGNIYNSFFQGTELQTKTAYTASKIDYPQEPFQTGFWHSSTAPTPFFDASYPGTSNGIPTLAGTWTGKLPELYKLNITATGAVGVATYKLSVRKHLGFNGSNYTDLAVGTPFRNPFAAAHPRHHGWRKENNDLLRWSNTQIVQYDDTGVTLLDIFDGTFTTWDSLSTPVLGATQIRQVAVDPANNLIYVACRNNGLYIINTSLNTVTLQLNNPCYGVDVGRNGRTFALVSGGLYSSNNWAVPETFTFTGISDGNWSRVYFLKADPEDTNDRIAIIADNTGGTNRRMVWWQPSTPTAVLGYEGSEIKKYPASLDVSNTGSFWAAQASRFIYGTTTRTALSWNVPSETFTHSIFGSDAYYKVDFFNDNLITNDRLISPANASVVAYTQLRNGTPTVLHLDSGIVIGPSMRDYFTDAILGTSMRQLFTDNAYCWTDYGWNGSNWVAGNANSKTTHSGAEALINGITVSFANGANPPHFTATNYFTQGICYGLWKDNATSLDYSSAWYSVPVIFDQPVNLTIPATAPYTLTLTDATTHPTFIRIETDTPQLHKFTINGTPVTQIYTNGAAPAPGEISMVSSGDGVLTFNSANAGQTLSGVYTWLRF